MVCQILDFGSNKLKSNRLWTSRMCKIFYIFGPNGLVWDCTQLPIKITTESYLAPILYLNLPHYMIITLVNKFSTPINKFLLMSKIPTKILISLIPLLYYLFLIKVLVHFLVYLIKKKKSVEEGQQFSLTRGC